MQTPVHHTHGPVRCAVLHHAAVVCAIQRASADALKQVQQQQQQEGSLCAVHAARITITLLALVLPCIWLLLYIDTKWSMLQAHTTTAGTSQASAGSSQSMTAMLGSCEPLPEYVMCAA